jgi:transcriptional regulator with XRE-family HTH domain
MAKAKTKIKRNKVEYGVEYDFGTILKKIRINRGLTQEEVADAIHVQPPTLSAYENDKQKPSIMILVDLANVYNVDVNELIGYITKTSEKSKINNLYAQLSTKNRKTVVDQAEYLLFRQEGNGELLNYNTKTQ